MIKQLKCQKCWYVFDYELEHGNQTIFDRRLAIEVRCKHCGGRIFTADKSYDRLLTAEDDDE